MRPSGAPARRHQARARDLDSGTCPSATNTWCGRSLYGEVRAPMKGHPLMLSLGIHRVARDHCLAPSRISGRGSYGRMFPDLESLSAKVSALEATGSRGGACAPAVARGDGVPTGADAAQAAGWPFFGQLVAHDITADRSPVGPQADPAALRNARSPKLSLEPLYGDGPVGNPYLYERADPALFLTADGGWDVPRNSQGVALIGDPRNDVHLFINQLHVVLLHAHNGIVARLRERGDGSAEVFDQARQDLIWHYQWIVIHDFLPRLVGAQVVADVLLAGGRHFAPPPGEAYLPLEFADAAYRYGHTQIRHAYQLRAGGTPLTLFPDLLGFGPVTADHHLDIAQIFDLPGRGPAQRAKKMDGTLPDSLIRLPVEVTGELTDEAYQSLAVRDLIRGQATGLPSGEAVAAALGAPALTRAQVGPGWDLGTPLWFYVLKEAQYPGRGEQLGPVGGRIVAEVIIGLVRADPGSYLSARPDWQPTLPHGDTFSLADLLLFAEANRRP